MSNELDELTGAENQKGQDVNVIAKQLPVTAGAGTKLVEIALWVVIPLLLGAFAYSQQMQQAQIGIFVVCGLVPGAIFEVMKMRALAYLRQLQQRVQAQASQIDNFLEQRVVILKNVVGLVSKSIELDKDVMKTVSAYRAGIPSAVDAERNSKSQSLDTAYSRIAVAFEAYPELRSQATIAEAMQQNSYLQKEITAARTLYNDTVAIWNQDIFSWPIKLLVAARAGYTTRIPFTASADIKAAATGEFF